MIDLASYAMQGRVFAAANVSAKSVIAVTTQMTGVILYNPLGSGRKYLLWDAGFAWTTAPAAMHNLGVAIASYSTTVPSSLTAIGSGVLCLDGSGTRGTSVAQEWDAATLAAAPVAVRWFGGNVHQAASGVGTTESEYSLVDHIGGAIALTPGSAACLTVVTTTAVGLGHLTWIEVDWPQ